MRTDSEIKLAGFEVLNHNLGMVEREKFDYTKWRKNLFEGLSGDEINEKAMEFQKTLKK
jgi:hypothetical protein